MTLNIERLAARWVLGLMPGDEIANAATQALAEGHDGPALRSLADTIGTTLREQSIEFEKALAELKAPQPSRTAAAMFLARDYAARILDGSLGPYEGAKKIWVELSGEVRPNDHSLDPFIYWADEYEDAQDTERRRESERAIVESARQLVSA